MFQGRDLVKAFKSIRFEQEADADAFVAQAGSATAAEIVKLLGAAIELGERSLPRVQAIRAHAIARLAEPVLGPELFTDGLRALRAADAELSKVLVPMLVRCNDVAAHAELCGLLRAPDQAVRGAAAEVLRLVGGRSALEIVAKLAADPSFPGRMEAMSALLPRAGVQGMPLIVAVLRGGRPMEKIYALRQLAADERYAKDPEGLFGAIGIALRDQDERVVAQAVTSLGQLDPATVWAHGAEVIGGHGVDVLKAFAVQVAQLDSESVVGFFRERMREGRRGDRVALLEAIQAAGAQHLSPALLDALASRDVIVRTRATEVVAELARLGRIDAAKAIVWLLRSKDPNVRRVAAEIANQVGDAEGTLAPRLLHFLRDEDWWVRERVLDALIEMNGAALTRHIVTEYLSDPSDVVRRFAVSALLRIADPRALGALVRTAQSDTDWFVCELAVEAIGKLGDPRATDYLVDLLGKRPELRVALIGALRALKSTEALPDVADLVHDEDPDVRAAAVQMLDELDDGSHALFVKGCEDDPSPTVREAAARLLRRFELQRVEVDVASGELRSLDAILVHALGRQADDLFLHAGRPPSIKRHGKVEPLGNTVLDAQAIRELIVPHLSHDQRLALEAKRDVDFSYQLAERDQRFRVNVFAHYTGLGAVFRAVRDEIAGLDALGVPPIVRSFAELPHGLVLVGGPTGAGKSTTLAALIDHMNKSSSRHIVTIEDPIEVVHRRVRSLINQRELGSHTRSFQAALRSTLRQDPDVILVGELRDLDTIAFAVTAAETGHLVLGTVHTSAADATLDRLINAFPTKQQTQVRSMLAESLRAVTCQYLVRSPQGGRALAVEVMINNEAIRSMIRKGKTFQIPSIIATSREHGMQLMDSELLRLVKEGRADLDDAYPKVLDKRAFEVALGLAPLEPVEPGAAGRASYPGTNSGASLGSHASVRPSSAGMPSQPPGAERLSGITPRIEELDHRSSFPPSRPSAAPPLVSPTPAPAARPSASPSAARASASMPAASPGMRPSGAMPAAAAPSSSPPAPAATHDPTSSRAPVRSNNTLFSRPPKPR